MREATMKENHKRLCGAQRKWIETVQSQTWLPEDSKTTTHLKNRHSFAEVSTNLWKKWAPLWHPSPSEKQAVRH